ncbi:MAG: hypothetical protein ACREQM_11305, partial [Candidatus Dormibacteraceae bacterium]
MVSAPGLAGIRRTIGGAPKQKQALLLEQLRPSVRGHTSGHASGQRAGARDGALLLVGFAGGFRRSELVALDVDDVEETEDGLRVTTRCSKSAQEGEGREMALGHAVIEVRARLPSPGRGDGRAERGEHPQ